MNKDQKDAFKSLILQLVAARKEEESHYVQQFYKLLVLGNGAGIVLLATFMGAVAQNAEFVELLVTPLVCFSIGAVLAASIYFPLMAVAGQSTGAILKQASEFFLNEIELEDIQHYGLNTKGRIIVFTLCLASLGMFTAGLYMCVGILRGVA